MKTKRPWLTIFLVLVVGLIFSSPTLTEQFIYNQQAVLHGELWRLISAPLTHISARHLFWNLLVFAVFGGLVENINRCALVTIYVFTALAAGISYLWFVPEMAFYGGLSGQATGLVAYFALYKISMCGDRKNLWPLLLVMLLVKISVEWFSGTAIFSANQTTSFTVLPSAHLWGIAGAVIALRWHNRAGHPRLSQNLHSGIFEQ